MLAIVIFNNSSQSQSNSIEIDFIKSVLSEDPGFKNLVFCNKLNSFVLKEISSHLKKRKIEGFDVNTRKKTALQLSKQEKHTLDAALHELQTNEWKLSQFPNATIIPADSLWTTLSFRNRTIISIYHLVLQNLQFDFIKPITIIRSFNIFTFSKPIFLRNGEVALFYSARLCGGECGEQSFMVFRKSGSVYKKWFEIFGGIF